MDVNFTPEDVSFREEVRSFIEENYPKHLGSLDRGDMSKEDLLAWHKVLHTKGWVAPSWPAEFGGTGWTVTQRYIFNEESARHGTIPPMPFGVQMLGPVIYTFGNQEQKDWVLPGILSGEDWWCQGYSEPGAGSDLASLKTEAVLNDEGTHYIVNGQKTWTTLGQHANMIFCLVRTDKTVKQQEGISFLLIDMDTPGVEVRPIILLDGTHEVNEVWFSDVKVPVENLVGKENEGWTYAKYLLTHERTNIAGVGFSQAGLTAVKRIAKAEMSGGKPLMQNPHFAARVAQVEIDLMAMSTTNLRIVSKAAAGAAPGVESSMLKVKGTIIRQEINDLARRAAGAYAMPFASEAIEGSNLALPDPLNAGPVAAQYFNNRKLSIFGGSNEIQRQIIAKTTMGGGA